MDYYKKGRKQLQNLPDTRVQKSPTPGCGMRGHPGVETIQIQVSSGFYYLFRENKRLITTLHAGYLTINSRKSGML